MFIIIIKILLLGDRCYFSVEVSVYAASYTGFGPAMRPGSFVDRLLPYLFTSFRANPFRFQAGGRKKRPGQRSGFSFFSVYLCCRH